MRIVLATCGSRGDVQPMIALARALLADGHDCLLAGPPESGAWARSCGCLYLSFGQDVTAFIRTVPHALDPKSMARFHRFVSRELERQLAELTPVFAGADQILAASLMFGAATIAEKLAIPYRYIAFTPQLFVSRAHPPPPVRFQHFPGVVNACLWQALLAAGRLDTGRRLNRYRKKQGLDPVSDAWDHILSDAPLAACDSVLVPLPRDGKKQAVQTGYLHLDTAESLPPALKQFVAGTKKRPVFSGFGSMPPKDQAKVIPMMIRCARIAGRKLVVGGPAVPYTGPAGPGKDVFFVRTVPHRRLFPGMGAVIHHGGAGTTATAAAAGVPQIIVPHILDQYYHGHKVQQAGVGPPPIWRSRLNAAHLQQSLDRVLEDDRMRQTAVRVSRIIADHDALRCAVRAVERGSPFKDPVQPRCKSGQDG